MILALKRDGEYMTVRAGPIFIVYPFDSNPDLKVQKYYSRSVWQVAASRSSNAAAGLPATKGRRAGFPRASGATVNAFVR